MDDVWGAEKPPSFRVQTAPELEDAGKDIKDTLPETNIAPENRVSQKENNIPTIHFQMLLLLVSGRVSLISIFSTTG